MIKWICGGLGWFLGGPAGGLSGFVAGTVVDSLEIRTFRKKRNDKKSFGIFSTNILMLIAAVLKTIKPLSRADVDFVKQFLSKNFGEKKTEDAVSQLQEFMKQDIPLNGVCKQIRKNLDYSSRLQLIHFLKKLVNNNENATESEQYIINIISEELGGTVKNKQIASPTINALTVEAYKILGVNSSTSVSDVKKAYRNLALKYHPDKVEPHQSEEKKKIASEKFQQLTRAYNIIKKERKFK